MQKVTNFFIAVIAVVLLGAATMPANKEKVKWLTLDEMQAEYSKNPRPILVDVYTDWCGWCKVMDKETYNNDKVASYINEHYYAVKFNAERRDSVHWGGYTFGYNAANKVNDLAAYLLGGQMSYPSTVFIPSLTDRPAPLAGFLKPKEIEAPLKFFGDGAYKKQNFPEFMKTFAGNW
jgi:thioredoxin-related protein